MFQTLAGAPCGPGLRDARWPADLQAQPGHRPGADCLQTQRAGVGAGLQDWMSSMPPEAARPEIFSVCGETRLRPLHRLPRPPRSAPGPDRRPLPAVPVPAVSALDAGLLATLHDAQEQLRWDACKPIDTAEIAALVNALRRYGPAAEPRRRPASLDELMARITPRHVDRFYQAMSVSDAERQRMDVLAFRSGLLNPSATFLSNLLNYGVAPVISAATGSTWAGTGFSIAVAYVVHAFATATQQTAAVAVCEHLRERGPTVVIDKTTIHDGNWVNDLPPRILDAMARYGVGHDALQGFMSRLAVAHGVVATADGAVPTLTDRELRTLLTRMDRNEHADFSGLVDEFCRCEARLQELLVDQLRAQGVVDRHREGNFWQTFPRCARAPLSSLCAMFRGISKDRIPGPGQHPEQLGRWPVAFLQAGLVPTVQFCQMLAAAGDERNKQHYHHLLNLLFADVFNPQGRAKAERGERIDAADIDAAKVRRLVVSPATALVERMTTVVNHVKATADAGIEALDARARQRAAKTSSPLASAPWLEQGDADLPFTPRERRERDELARFSADLACDQAALQAGRLIETARRGDSFAGALLADRARHYFSGLLLRDIRSRYAKPGEFTSQLIQRLSSMFIGVVFGTAVSSTIGKIITSLKGGSSQVSRSLIGGLAALTLFFSAVGAVTQYILLAIKNHRRMNPAEVSALRQLWLGVMAPCQILQSRHTGPRVMRQANALLDGNDLLRQLGRTLQERPAADVPSPS